MAYAELLESLLGRELEDADEETFWLYSQPIPSSNLGFVDPKATVVEACVGGVDYTIHQSPGVLSSNRAGGTTGAGKFNAHASPGTTRFFLYIYFCLSFFLFLFTVFGSSFSQE
ncbi:hypothetical protein IF2G_07694 [Cordyceps javanica]|nr:hypothetical protein IF2G_07694 [Cordyceps javanica]